MSGFMSKNIIKKAIWKRYNKITNMHIHIFQLQSSCKTIKNVTLDEMYPGMCDLIEKFSELCNARENAVEKKINDGIVAENQTVLSPSIDGNSSELHVHGESAKISEGGLNIIEQ